MKRISLFITWLIVIALIILLIESGLMTSTINNKQYKICSNNSCYNSCYYADSYTTPNQGQCVYLTEKEIRICGNYIIEKLKND